MLNQIVLVGRLTSEPELKVTEGGKQVSNITLAIPRSYKNTEGEYETDFVKCTLWNSVATNTSEYCKKGDMVGIKGRLESNSFEKEDGTKQFSMNVVAEKVTFLSSRAQEKNQDNER